MFYVSNGFKPFFFFVFLTCPCTTHTHTYSIGHTQKSIGYRVFRLFSEVSGTVEAVFPGHIHLLAQTCSGLEFPSYIKVTPYPLEP
jgi:hypothetical protein